jgi:acyl-coenzyme A synthetase/AMP-(fatty) acid ligase
MRKPMTDAAGPATKAPSAGDWVDDTLLAGNDSDVCLWLGGPIDRRELRRLVAQRQKELAAAGLLAGGTATLRLPPSLTYIASLLAAWRIGAQVSLLDHRLTDHEVERALGRLEPQVVVSAAGGAAPGPMRAYAEVTDGQLGERDRLHVRAARPLAGCRLRTPRRRSSFPAMTAECTRGYRRPWAGTPFTGLAAFRRA